MPKLVKVSTEGIGVGKVKYASSEYGPFDCGHCAWFTWGTKTGLCSHPEVVEDDAMKKNSDGLAVVEATGCCNEFRPTRKLGDVKFTDAGI